MTDFSKNIIKSKPTLLWVAIFILACLFFQFAFYSGTKGFLRDYWVDESNSNSRYPMAEGAIELLKVENALNYDDVVKILGMPNSGSKDQPRLRYNLGLKSMIDGPYYLEVRISHDSSSPVICRILPD